MAYRRCNAVVPRHHHPKRVNTVALECPGVLAPKRRDADFAGQERRAMAYRRCNAVVPRHHHPKRVNTVALECPGVLAPKRREADLAAGSAEQWRIGAATPSCHGTTIRNALRA